MSLLFNSKPSGDCYDDWSFDLALNRGNQRFLPSPNTLNSSHVDDSDMIISSNYIPAPLPSFTVEPDMGSVDRIDNFSQFNTDPSFSNFRTFSLGGSVGNSSSQHSVVPLGGPVSRYPLYQQSLVRGFSDSYFPNPSDLTPDIANSFTPFILSHSNLGNQGFLHESNNIDIRGKHVPRTDQTCSGIAQQSSADVMQAMPNSSNVYSSCLTDNAYNEGTFLQRFNRESFSRVSADHFTKENEQKGGEFHTMMRLAHVDGANYFSIDTVKRQKTSEERSGGEKRKERGNLYQCKLCNMSFSTGNALGGHMSYHAKKKSEAESISQLSKHPHDTDVAFGWALNLS